jgi:hypothetical protein
MKNPSKREKQQLSVSPPQQPPPDIPLGGSAAKTPYPKLTMQHVNRFGAHLAYGIGTAAATQLFLKAFGRS